MRAQFSALATHNGSIRTRQAGAAYTEPKSSIAASRAYVGKFRTNSSQLLHLVRIAHRTSVKVTKGQKTRSRRSEAHDPQPEFGWPDRPTHPQQGQQPATKDYQQNKFHYLSRSAQTHKGKQRNALHQQNSRWFGTEAHQAQAPLNHAVWESESVHEKQRDVTSASQRHQRLKRHVAHRGEGERHKISPRLSKARRAQDATKVYKSEDMPKIFAHRLASTQGLITGPCTLSNMGVRTRQHTTDVHHRQDVSAWQKHQQQ
mgnify:CR=1 FL=1